MNSGSIFIKSKEKKHIKMINSFYLLIFCVEDDNQDFCRLDYVP